MMDFLRRRLRMRRDNWPATAKAERHYPVMVIAVGGGGGGGAYSKNFTSSGGGGSSSVGGSITITWIGHH